MSKVIVFALDGCTYSIVKHLKIPFFEMLAETGRIGDMETVPPANTTIGWSSFYTGKNPAKTGIFNITEGDTLASTFQQSRSGVDSPALWDVIGNEGLKSIVFNMPVTYPALPMNGVLLSSFDTKGDAWCYPYELKEKIEKHWTPNEKPLSDYSTPDTLFNDLWQKAGNEANVFASLLEQTSWDLAIVTFLELDRISHALMNRGDPTTQLLVKQMYMRVGDMCMKLWNLVKDEDVTCVVVCDHGMMPTNSGFFINSYLYDTGLLELQSDKAPIFDAYGDDLPISMVNFKDSNAWTEGLGGIVLKNDDHLDDVVGFLKEYIDPFSEKNVFADVLPREKVWNGKYLDKMPRLLAFPADGFEVHWSNVTKDLMRLNRNYSDHKLTDGYYAISSMDVEDKPANILEISATILDLLNVKVPKDFDKKPL